MTVVDCAGPARHHSSITDAHLRSVVMGRSHSIPVVGGALALCESGRIDFADFDQTRARERTARLQIVGE